MIVFTAVHHPEGSPSGAHEIMHGTITTTDRSFDNCHASYAAHLLQRPNKEVGVEGYEADVTVTEFMPRLGLAPLLGSIFYHVAPVPMEYEPIVRIDARLVLKELDEFNKRLRGR